MIELIKKQIPEPIYDPGIEHQIAVINSKKLKNNYADVLCCFHDN